MTALARFDRSQPCPKCGAPERTVRWDRATKSAPERLVVRCRCGFADQFAPLDGGATVSTLPLVDARRSAMVQPDAGIRGLRSTGELGGPTP